MSVLDIGRRARIGRRWGKPPPVAIAIAFLWIAVILAASIAAPAIAPFGYAEQQPLLRLKPPAILGYDNPFLFGSDHLGRDVFSRVLYGIRFSIVIALFGTVLGMLIGVVLGMLAARLRGWWEEAIMMLVDIQASLPFIIFAITVVAFFGKSFWLLVLIVGFAGWERYARLARGLVLDAETTGYAGALRALGAGSPRIYVRHILPNIVGALIVQMTLNFPEVILLETGLSFLGLGVQPPLTSLGLLVNESRNYIVLAWWMAAVPGAVIVLTTLSVSLIGDWMRDHFDARLR
ncbi:ABC transporter permease [Chelatococcus asaccharovorans]|uniref:ABC transporter permease n=1 Tax=Chelatococcus asaccharovorans TaxID=28210 RepID=UPI00224C7168|nr:ABC transporter permease [Chelatococcus asaccharovorans]CAH1649043.1 Peptide/nickel transport system permease protein [Chelatococcus asaccharovorans]CAH1687221.1 Peptide/nickel transport system permease protein [Chelatococcus asaccharovorans]